MSILNESTKPPRMLNYLMVGHEKTILADYSPDSGNFVEFVSKIIGYLKRGRFILTFKENEIIYLKEKEDDGVFFLMIASENIKKLESFALLELIRKEFVDSFDLAETQNCKPLGLNKEFRGLLERQYKYCSQLMRGQKPVTLVDVITKNLENFLMREQEFHDIEEEARAAERESQVLKPTPMKERFSSEDSFNMDMSQMDEQKLKSLVLITNLNQNQDARRRLFFLGFVLAIFMGTLYIVLALSCDDHHEPTTPDGEQPRCSPSTGDDFSLENCFSYF